MVARVDRGESCGWQLEQSNAGSARFVWWLPRREEKCEDGTRCSSGEARDCGAGEVTSLKQPFLVGGNVVEVELEHLLRAASLV